MNRTLLATAILTSIALVGCGGGSSSSKVTPESQSKVSGVVNKGLVRDGLVKVCVASAANVTEQQCPNGEVLGSTKTDERGQYTFSGLPQNRALLFVLTSHDDPDIITQMKCDFQACLDEGKTLGEWMNVDDDFKLISILASDADSITAHMTSITDAIAKHTIRASRGSEEVNLDVINSSRSVMAQLFGLDAQKVMSLGAVDLTDAAAIQAAADAGDVESLKVAALSAAFADTKPNLDNLFTLADNLISSVDGEETNTWEEERKALLTGASSVINTVVTELSKDENVDLKLEDVVQKIDDAKGSPPKITPPTATDEITTAKALVKQVRTVYDATQEEGALREGFIRLGDSLDPIPDLLQDDVTATFETLTSALMSIAHKIDDQLVEEAGDWQVTQQGDTYTINTETVKLVVSGSASLVLDEQETEQGGSMNDSAAINLTISELWIQQGSVELEAASGKAEVVSFVSQESWEHEASEGDHDFSETWMLKAEKLHFALNEISLKAKDKEENPLLLTGRIAFTANQPEIKGKHSSSHTSTEQQGQSENFDEETFSARSLDFNLGVRLDYQDQTLDTSLSIALDNPNGVVYFTSMREAWQWGEGYNYEVSKGSDLALPGSSLDDIKPETATQFLRGSLLVSLESKVNPDNPQLAKVSLQASRPAFDLLNLNGSIVYNEQSLTLKTQINTEKDEPLNVELSNGQAIAHLREDDKGQVVGTIKVGNKQVASIDAPRNSVSVVRYINGQFESLF
ncbi:hypothetical protein P0F39_002026 [Vibrio metschnikovii]|uniref:hypothetical protein n=1 Tax=Vibrio metschnikovii TaxID=28172 RepID=UPI001C30221A|nr:hypothetical protein [Vibrio metschnikovii]EKO3780488.1 hypothetical protein [Vibrio metschnikovii]EKO3887540.1 hypothetical protein [Vibrio metschnikovii]EKO3936072.1 hypothetical protein [Vibrio metschnikovii]